MPKFMKIAIMLLLVAACSKFDKRDDLSIVNGDNEKATFKVELAQTKDEMRQGLMNRENLDANSGMLFDLSHVDVQTAMWMKNTKIALDMLFIDKEGTVFWIYENAEPESTKLIVSPYPAYAVLEINAGEVKKFNIQIGDEVQHEWFQKSTPETAVAEEKLENVIEEKDDAVVANNAENIAENEASETEVKAEEKADDVVVNAPTEEKETSVKEQTTEK